MNWNSEQQLSFFVLLICRSGVIFMSFRHSWIYDALYIKKIMCDCLDFVLSQEQLLSFVFFLLVPSLLFITQPCVLPPVPCCFISSVCVWVQVFTSVFVGFFCSALFITSVLLCLHASLNKEVALPTVSWIWVHLVYTWMCLIHKWTELNTNGNDHQDTLWSGPSNHLLRWFLSVHK